MAPKPRFVVGIDLGTTHTVVASADTAGASETAPPRIESFHVSQLIAPGEVEARSMLPSVRYHPSTGELAETDTLLPWGRTDGPEGVVGQLALEMGAKVPGRVVTSAKSWLSHGAVDRTAPILPWGAPDEVLKVSPVDASASYLRHIRSAWDLAHPEHPLDEQEVVLTVPASFDEAARGLTLAAAEDAGLPKLRLVEEPQAAFYDWLDRTRDDLEEALEGTRLAVVVDVGGGTTDLTLIKVELRESGPRLTRIAVGDHLMLGGDNMDLTLARHLEPTLAKGAQLGSARFSQLVAQSRAAKERLLAREAPEQVRVTVLGSGSKLIGGSKSAELSGSDVRDLVLDGFFPAVDADARPSRRRGALVEFGLPYVADPAVTRHLAGFLAAHEALAREALGDRAPAEGELPIPDTVLLNGGVFRGAALQDRLLETLTAWRGARPKLLENESPELAVGRGAVAYGLARRGMGLRIGGGSARNYFLVVDEKDAIRKGVCVLPRGAEEGEDVVLEDRTFSLRLGRPVRFPLASSASDVRYHRPGDTLDLDGDQYRDLPPIAAVLEANEADAGTEVPVKLITALTEVGTLEMSCVDAEHVTRRWKLEFQLRGETRSELAAQRVTQLHPRFEEATDRVRAVYGKSKQEVDKKAIKSLQRDLVKILGERNTWNTPLLRELFGALLAGVKRRRRSPDHERIWFNLIGYSLRPGFGYPLDEWRVEQVFSVFDAGVQFMPETQNQAEWWIMWRRIAGGLSAEMQNAIIDDIEWYLHPPKKRARPRPAGPKKLGYDDMVRLAGSLEHIEATRKEQLGNWFLTRLTEHDENPQTWWSVGRLGSRVPFYGSAHKVVARGIAEAWLERCLATSWDRPEHAPFAATMLGRKSGDRERDVSSALGAQVAERLRRVGAPESWQAMVSEVTHLEAADERRIFGESLPPGLRLLD